MSIFGAIGSYIVTFFKAIAGQLGVKTAQFLEEFAKEDLGKLAIDAVDYVEGALPGAGSVEKRDAAAAKLKTDAIAAGHDVAAFATSTWNWLIETALQAANGLKTVVAANDPDVPPPTA